MLLRRILVLLGVVCALSLQPAAAKPKPQPIPLTLKRVQLTTGVKLEYAEQGNPKGQPIIFLHGYTDSWHSWELVLPHLAGQYHLYSLSQRGHGDSDRPACCYSQADFAADVDAFMQVLGIKRATIIGHSMGSMIAQQVALSYPKRVKQLVLVGATPNANNEGVIGLNDVVQTLTDPLDPVFVREFQVSTLSSAEAVPPAFLETVVAESLKVPANVWKAALSGLLAVDYTPNLGRIKAPTLIVWGDRDTVFPQSDQVLLDQQIRRSTLITYAGVGHGVHWEQPSRFAQDLTTFLKRPNGH